MAWNFLRSSHRACSVLLRPATLLKKETLALVLSCEFCEISENTFSSRIPLGDCFCFLTTFRGSDQSFSRNILTP